MNSGAKRFLFLIEAKAHDEPKWSIDWLEELAKHLSGSIPAGRAGIAVEELARFSETPEAKQFGLKARKIMDQITSDAEALAKKLKK